VEELTGRELKILDLLADGFENHEIAEQLGISTETVKTHVRHLRTKLGARNRAHAVAIAFSRRLVTWKQAGLPPDEPDVVLHLFENGPGSSSRERAKRTGGETPATTVARSRFGVPRSTAEAPAARRSASTATTPLRHGESRSADGPRDAPDGDSDARARPSSRAFIAQVARGLRRGKWKDGRAMDSDASEADAALTRVARAADQVARLEPGLVAARREIHAAILAAHREGVASAEIARAAGLSRARVSQLVRR
jgi:DNA-binding CsgD family transcriptional regulator